MNKRITVVSIHLLSWISFCLLPLLLLPKSAIVFDLDHAGFLIEFTVSNLLMIAFFYLNYLYAIPRFYFQRKRVAYSLFVIGVLGGIIAFLVFVLHPDQPGTPFPDSPPQPILGSILMRALIVFLISFALRIYVRWKAVEEEKMQAELSYLKAQINPHFLFNTLNSIYSLAVKKSDSAPEAVVKLSYIMRYVTSDAHQEMVSLDKEIAYITNYVDLQRLRITPNMKIDYTVIGDPKGRQIAPLLLITFVENAFKFGISTEVEATVQIKITVDRGGVYLYVYNQKVNKPTRSEGAGVGMENTLKRLDLHYPGQHILAIDDEKNDYKVSLKINWA